MPRGKIRLNCGSCRGERRQILSGDWSVPYTIEKSLASPAPPAAPTAATANGALSLHSRAAPKKVDK